MTPWQQLEAARTCDDVRAVGARVFEVSLSDRPLFLRRMREADRRIERARAVLGPFDLNWECGACRGLVRIVGRKDGRELGRCDRCLVATSRKV